MQEPEKTQIEPNIEAVISYFPFIGSVFMYLYEKENKFVRFHAIQALAFWLVVLGINGIIVSLRFIFIGYILDTLFQVSLVGVWFFLMYKAYKYEEYELPIIGKIAKDQTYK